MSIPLAFVSPQTLLLESFRQALSGADFQVRLMPFQGQFADMELIESRPRIVVLDSACEGGTPMVWIDRLKVALPDTRVLVYLRQVRGAECQTLLSVGAKGLADQRISGTEVLAGIRRMLRGEVYLSPRVAQAIALCRLDLPIAGGASRAHHRLEAAFNEGEVLEVVGNPVLCQYGLYDGEEFFTALEHEQIVALPVGVDQELTIELLAYIQTLKGHGLTGNGQLLRKGKGLDRGGTHFVGVLGVGLGRDQKCGGRYNEE